MTRIDILSTPLRGDERLHYGTVLAPAARDDVRLMFFRYGRGDEASDEGYDIHWWAVLLDWNERMPPPQDWTWDAPARRGMLLWFSVSTRGCRIVT